MNLAGFSFFFCCCFYSSVIPPAAGKPLQSAPHGRVSAAAGGDVVLPCRLSSSVSRVTAVEWTRVDSASPLTVHVLRDGEELVKEKAPEYVGRTAVMEDGSLKLLDVQRRDSGTYRCSLLRGPSDEELVSLFVAQLSEVNVSVRRTSDDQLLVGCESSGWSPAPVLALLDARRSALAARTESSVRPDLLYAVRGSVSVAAAGAMLICRVELPGTSLASENKIYITDEFAPPQDGPGRYLALLVSFALVCVAASLLFIVPLRTIVKLRSSVQRLAALVIRLITRQSTAPDEYGDILRVETTGASEHTARAIEQLYRGVSGVEASNRLAERDLTEVLMFRDMIVSVGNTLSIRPALIAAIISRQSRAGIDLNRDGYGATDPDCFGLMQINKHYHAVKGNAYSREHVDQGVTFFIQLCKTMKRTKPRWNREQQLKAALACYVAGEERVIPLAYDELDSVTPYGDFANDVVARAQWFALHGF
ncbi:butyrophilin-like protein 3 isoform X2 [Cottoperca gobio]|uniref:Lysozyme g n=1 Tax=Cottoperca gobio TaxID=56716 RepID=A0A6J2PDH1_COTGO|nr:butyrophilin-like protein 3 isoform X2 [Cottoperca gobio]